MRILLTRPKAEAEAMQALLTADGHEVTLAPLLAIALEDIPIDTVAGASGLIATSRNALKALARAPALPIARAKPLFTVGPATSEFARSLGFHDIRQGTGTAASLVPLISANRDGFGRSPLVHLAGDHTAFDLETALRGLGQQVSQVRAYRQVAAESLSPDVIAKASNGGLDAVVLMSPRTARIWSGLVKAYGIEDISRKMTHVCLSGAVAEGIGFSPKPPIAIAVQPQASEIVALIARLAENRASE